MKFICVFRRIGSWTGRLDLEPWAINMGDYVARHGISSNSMLDDHDDGDNEVDEVIAWGNSSISMPVLSDICVDRDLAREVIKNSNQKLNRVMARCEIPVSEETVLSCGSFSEVSRLLRSYHETIIQTGELYTWQMPFAMDVINARNVLPEFGEISESDADFQVHAQLLGRYLSDRPELAKRLYSTGCSTLGYFVISEEMYLAIQDFVDFQDSRYWLLSDFAVSL